MPPTLPSPPAEQALDVALMQRWPLPADQRSDKVSRGTVLVIGGSIGTPGAAMLAGLGALRVGAGRLQIATAPEVSTAVAVAVPESRVAPFDDRPLLVELIRAAEAVVIGPGLDDLGLTTQLFDLVLGHAADAAVVVVDALGLVALAERSGHLGERGRRIVATPNHDELVTLAGGIDTADELVRVVAGELGVTVTSFGRVADSTGRSWVDRVQVSGLGTSGAGDVLAGLIGGLGARSHDPAQAACWGTLIHRTAASRLSVSVAPVGYLARELLDELPPALATLTT